MTICDNGVGATTMSGMTATEFVVLNNTDRDALREPWRVRPLFARCALELQENDEVRVTLFGLRKLPYTYRAPANISSVQGLTFNIKTGFPG